MNDAAAEIIEQTIRSYGDCSEGYPSGLGLDVLAALREAGYAFFKVELPVGVKLTDVRIVSLSAVD